MAGPCPSALSPCQAPAKPPPSPCQAWAWFPTACPFQGVLGGGLVGTHCPCPRASAMVEETRQACRAADRLCLGPVICWAGAACLEPAPHRHSLGCQGPRGPQGCRRPVCLGGPCHVPWLEKQQGTKQRLWPRAACVLLQGDGSKAGDGAGGRKIKSPRGHKVMVQGFSFLFFFFPLLFLIDV